MIESTMIGSTMMGSTAQQRRLYVLWADGYTRRDLQYCCIFRVGGHTLCIGDVWSPIEQTLRGTPSHHSLSFTIEFGQPILDA